VRAASRVISYSPSEVETLFALGAGDRCVARNRYATSPPEVLALPVVDSRPPSPADALRLRADLVILPGYHRAAEPSFRDAGLRVLVVPAPATLEEALERVSFLGSLVGLHDQAGQLVARMRERVAAVLQSIEGVQAGPRLFWGQAGLNTTAGCTFVGDMLALLRTRNIAADHPSPWPRLRADEVIAADPEVILMNGESSAKSLRLLAVSPGWQEVAAVRSGRIHVIEDRQSISHHGPRLVEGLEAMARLIYSESSREA
jgi:iron complex transport system substrate-binding protein